MIIFLLLLVVLAGLVVATYLLGFRLGGEHWREELFRVQTESVAAERRIHDLTRQAFVAMAEDAERRGR